MFNKFVGTIAVASALVLAAPASAASFIFTGGNTDTYGTAGKSMTFKDVPTGITVTATAWSVNGTAATNLPNDAYLGRYSNGLGVTDDFEGKGNVNNSHTIDNAGGNYDFVMLMFSSAVKLTGITLTGYDVDGGPSAADTDAWVSNGSGDLTANWAAYINKGVKVDSGYASNFSGAAFSTVWLIGASRTTTVGNDGFKLGAVTAVAAVPEPATWMTMILGFGLMGASLRRRSKLASRSAVSPA
jgi:hypothetical protein